MMTSVQIDYRIFSAIVAVFIMAVLAVVLISLYAWQMNRRIQSIIRVASLHRDGYRELQTGIERLRSSILRDNDSDMERAEKVAGLQSEVIAHFVDDLTDIVDFAEKQKMPEGCEVNNGGSININRNDGVDGVTTARS